MSSEGKTGVLWTVLMTFVGTGAGAVFGPLVGVGSAVIVAAVGGYMIFDSRKRNGFDRQIETSTKSALDEIGWQEKRALRHLLSNGNEFVVGVTDLPSGLNISETIQAFENCAVRGLVKRERRNTLPISRRHFRPSCLLQLLRGWKR